MEEVSHWGWALRFYSLVPFPVHSLLPDYGNSVRPAGLLILRQGPPCHNDYILAHSSIFEVSGLGSMSNIPLYIRISVFIHEAVPTSKVQFCHVWQNHFFNVRLHSQVPKIGHYLAYRKI